MNIEMRRKYEVNTDPQRRCYNGCHAKSELRWSSWETVDFDIAEERIESRLEFWRDLNDYAVSQRGAGAKAEFRSCDS